MRLRLSHRQFNHLLTAVAVGLGFYLLVAPLLPNLNLWLKQRLNTTGGYVYRGVLASEFASNRNGLKAPPTDDRLVIPEIQLDEPVKEGSSIGVIGNGGVWRRPNTSTPDSGGNTVLVGHRFSYAKPATFYHLDKLDPGEKFSVWWRGNEYVYEVFDRKVVPATAIEIEANTKEPMMTLYTCAPIWTAKDRLVVRARLLNTSVLEARR